MPGIGRTIFALLAIGDFQNHYEVDVLVLNRVRNVHESTDKYGRPVYTYSHQHWWSFWDRPFGGPPDFWINRGYVKKAELVKASGGWLLILDGETIFAPTIWMVDSPYDFEIKYRRLVVPLRKGG